MAKRKEKPDGAALQDVPLISAGVLGLALNVGMGTIKSKAKRLGIKIESGVNNRGYLTFAQACTIHEALAQRGVGSK